MKKNLFFTGLTALAILTASCEAADTHQKIGVVNFSTCISDSKIGKQEQASFESLKKQLTTLLEDTEKQLTEISQKLNDPEFMDGLSPEGEDELKNKFRMLNEELNRYQGQYYQVLNQANMRIVQMLSNSIATAAEKVAKDKQLTIVLNREACFFCSPQLEVTTSIVSEMDKVFDIEAKKQAAAAEALPAPVAQKAVETPKTETVKSDTKAQ